jgi:hypothetical protein
MAVAYGTDHHRTSGTDAVGAELLLAVALRRPRSIEAGKAAFALLQMEELKP